MTDEARNEIAALQRELYEKRNRVAELKRSLAPEPVDNVLFQTSDGAVSLASLFGDMDDLILVHNMGQRCPYCTLWADGFTGIHAHVNDRAAFVVCSPDAPDVQQAFAASRAWPFRMVSDQDGTFTTAMGYRQTRDDGAQHLPGFSTFRKNPDGSIVRIASGQFGPGDEYAGIWHFFEHLEGGPKDWHPQFSYERTP